MERFAQFVSQLLLSSLDEVMPDTSITTATVCVAQACTEWENISVCIREIYAGAQNVIMLLQVEHYSV